MAKRLIENEQFFRNVVRSRDNWICQECGSNEYVQAHHIEHYNGNNNNPGNGITLCVYCHANKHPEVPYKLFISQAIKTEKEGNISTSKLAKELNVHPRTIVRHARRLGIIQPMQHWTFTQDEVESIRDSFVKPDKIKLEKKGSYDDKVNFFIPKTFMMDPDLHYQMKLLSAFNARPLSEEIERALLDYLEKYQTTILRLKGDTGNVTLSNPNASDKM